MVMLAFRMIHAALHDTDPMFIMVMVVIMVVIMMFLMAGTGVDGGTRQVRQRHRQKRKGQAEDEKLNGGETAHSLQ